MKLMFTEISWGLYLKVTAASVLFYYTFLFIKHYRPQATFPGAGYYGPAPADTDTTHAMQQARENLTPTGAFAEADHNDYDVIEEMVARVKAALGGAAEGDINKDDLTGTLALILKDYPLLRKSNFRPSINEFIASESQQHGFDFITEDLAEQLWHNV